jgi:LysR family transcriptional regulator, regulator for metE and metH
VEFEIGNSENPVQELEAKRYDLIITVMSPSNETFSSTPLFQDQLVCILQKDHPFGAQSYIHLQDFSKMNLISHAEKGKNKFYQGALKPRGIEPKRFMTVGQPQAIIEMVASGFGVSIFPRWAVKNYLASAGIMIRPITRNGLPLTWTATFLKTQNIPIFQNEFINIIGQLDLTEPY